MIWCISVVSCTTISRYPICFLRRFIEIRSESAERLCSSSGVNVNGTPRARFPGPRGRRRLLGPGTRERRKLRLDKIPPTPHLSVYDVVRQQFEANPTPDRVPRGQLRSRNGGVER